MTRRFRLRTFTVETQARRGKRVQGPDQAAAFVRAILGECDQDREHFILLALDAQNHIRGFKVLSSGTPTASLVHAGTVYRDALALGAVGIIVAHNHPSGDCTPSADDLALTRKLREAGDVLEVKLHDHLIIGADAYVSLAAQGAL
jgi:DNA repair protein RadC